MLSTLENIISTKWPSVIPLNVTVTALDTTPNNTLVTNTATTIARPTGASKVEIIPDVIPSAPIYIKWSFGTATDATVTTYDQKLSECKPFAEFVRANDCSHISLISTGTPVLSVIFS